MPLDAHPLAVLDPRTSLIKLIGGVDGESVLAWWWDGNPLREQVPALEDGAAPLIVLWSGNLSEDPFAAHPPTWLKPGHEALEQFCAAIRPRLESAARGFASGPTGGRS